MNNLPSSRRATPHLAEAPQTDGLRGAQGRAALPAFRRLNVHWWFTPLLTAATLVCAAALVIVAFLGAQANALASAQARNGQAAWAASALLTSDGAGLSLDANGELVASGNGMSVIPAHNGATADRLEGLFGEGIAIYQYQNGKLMVISTSKSVVSAQGAQLDSAASAELIGQCATTKVNCHQQYTGETQINGVTYVAGFAPLFDSAGMFLGVVAVITPLSVVMQPPMQLLVTLSLVGLLVTLAALAVGLWLFGSLAGRRLDDVRARLGALGAVAANVEETVYAHATRARRQERVSRQLAEDAYQLDALANALEQGYAALQDEVHDVWSGVSQPGAAPDGQSMLRLARQTAVAAARLGAEAEDAALLSRQMSPLMNTLIAEDRALAESAQATEQLAGELRAALDQVEMALGSRLAPRPQNALSDLLARARAVSQRLKRQTTSTGPNAATSGPHASGRPRRSMPPVEGAAHTGETGAYWAPRATSGAPQTGAHPSVRPQTGQHPAARPQTGQHPSVRPQTGQHPAARPHTGQHPAAPQRPGGAPQTPWPGGSDANSAKGASSSGWRTPSGEYPSAPRSAPGEYQSPWLSDLPSHPSHPSHPSASGRQYPNHPNHPNHPNTPSHPGRDLRATDTGWLND